MSFRRDQRFLHALFLVATQDMLFYSRPLAPSSAKLMLPFPLVSLPVVNPDEHLREGLSHLDPHLPDDLPRRQRHSVLVASTEDCCSVPESEKGRQSSFESIPSASKGFSSTDSLSNHSASSAVVILYDLLHNSSRMARLLRMGLSSFKLRIGPKRHVERDGEAETCVQHEILREGGRKRTHKACREGI